jgi:hypothetical protein
MASLQFQLDS